MIQTALLISLIAFLASALAFSLYVRHMKTQNESLISFQQRQRRNYPTETYYPQEWWNN